MRSIVAEIKMAYTETHARALRARWDKYIEDCFNNGKKCTKCLQVKPLTEFVPDPARTTGVRSTCRECANKRWNDWNSKHPDWRKQRQFRVSQKAKDAAYKAYGGYICACCGETEPIFLTIDHINNDGNKHREKIGSQVIYYWLRDQGYPSGFQILCWNCNRAKHYNGGVCIHQDLKIVDLVGKYAN